jgi:hypothetical protein
MYNDSFVMYYMSLNFPVISGSKLAIEVSVTYSNFLLFVWVASHLDIHKLLET